MHYIFDVDDAKKYGVDEAILLQNLRFWIVKNKATQENYYEGRTWTYNSANAFIELFPFWTINQIRTIIDSLLKQDVLIKENFNKMSYDRTLWYAFKNEPDFIPEMKNMRNYHGFIYIIKNNKGYYKIGLSKNIKSRLMSYKEIEIIATYETSDSYSDEKKLHSFFKNKHIGGEWFSLDANDLKTISIWDFSQMDICENGNGIVENTTPIPDINTDVNTDVNTNEKTNLNTDIKIQVHNGKHADIDSKLHTGIIELFYKGCQELYDDKPIINKTFGKIVKNIIKVLLEIDSVHPELTLKKYFSIYYKICKDEKGNFWKLTPNQFLWGLNENKFIGYKSNKIESAEDLQKAYNDNSFDKLRRGLKE